MLDPMPSLLDPLGLETMRVQWWKATVLPANWKIAMEAFVEGYHIMASHPALTQGLGEAYDPGRPGLLGPPPRPLAYANRPGSQRRHQQRVDEQAQVEALIEASQMLCEGLEAMTLPRDLRAIETLRQRPVPEGGSLGAELVRVIYEQAASSGVPLPRLGAEELGRWGGVFFVFPHYFVLPQYGNALIYRFRPLDGPEQCLLELWSVTIPAAGEEFGPPTMGGPFAPDDADHFGWIPRQDFANIVRQQRGLHNRGFKGSRLSPTHEVGITHLHREIDRYLATPATEIMT